MRRARWWLLIAVSGVVTACALVGLPQVPVSFVISGPDGRLAFEPNRPAVLPLATTAVKTGTR